MTSGLSFEALIRVDLTCAKAGVGKKAGCFGGTAVQRAEGVEPRLQRGCGTKFRTRIIYHLSGSSTVVCIKISWDLFI